MENDNKELKKKKENTEKGKRFLVGILSLFILPIFVMLCWNFLAQELPIKIGQNVIALPQLAYSHALVLYVLCNILFKAKIQQDTKAKTPENNTDKAAVLLEVLKQKTFN